MDEMVADLGCALSTAIDRPSVVFGYSMGALVAYEAVRWLEEHELPLPRHLIVAACSAPGAGPRPVGEQQHWNDEELLGYLEGRGVRLPEQVLADSELRELSLATMRADLRVLATYRIRTRTPLSVPITVLAGAADRTTSEDSLELWNSATTGGCDRATISGGHLFMHESPEATHSEVRRVVDGVLGRCRPNGEGVLR